MGNHQPTRRALLRLVGGAASALACARAASAAARPEDLVRESIYNYIIISRDEAAVSFRRMENGAVVSSIKLAKPSYQLIPYTKYLFAPWLINPAPTDVLSIGLGAGSFNRLFNLCRPDAVLTTVEIDPMIRDLAVEFTHFQETPRNQVVIDDGRRFLRRSGDRWDWIIIDAFVRNSQYPPHLATREFFELVAGRLRGDGLLAINVIQGNKLFDCMVTTIEAVFPGCLIFDVPGKGNAIVLACTSASPSLAEKIKLASPISPLLLENGVDLGEIRSKGSLAGATTCANPLTDDFAPTEFLGEQKK